MTKGRINRIRMPASRFWRTSRKAKPMARPPMPSKLNRSAAEMDVKATEVATRNETSTVTPPAIRPSTAAEPVEASRNEAARCTAARTRRATCRPRPNRTRATARPGSRNAADRQSPSRRPSALAKIMRSGLEEAKTVRDSACDRVAGRTPCLGRGSGHADAEGPSALGLA